MGVFTTKGDLVSTWLNTLLTSQTLIVLVVLVGIYSTNQVATSIGLIYLILDWVLLFG